MFYRLRRGDGSTDPHSAGTIVLRTPVALAAGEVVIDTLSTWVSPRGEHRYPARTRLRVPRPIWQWRSRPGSPTRSWRSRCVTGRGPSRGAGCP